MSIATELTRAETELITVRAAIDKALKAQVFTVGEQSVTRQRLRELTDRESFLLRRIEQLTNVSAGRPSQASAAFQ